MMIEKQTTECKTLREYKCDLCITDGKSTSYSSWMLSCPICERHMCVNHRTNYPGFACLMMEACYSDPDEGWSYVCCDCGELFRDKYIEKMKSKIDEVKKYDAWLKLTWKYLYNTKGK